MTNHLNKHADVANQNQNMREEGRVKGPPKNISNKAAPRAASYLLPGWLTYAFTEKSTSDL